MTGTWKEPAPVRGGLSETPDATRKVRQAQRALSFAERIVESEDREAALEQVRGTLLLTARWLLPAHGVFPLSRDELSGQVLDLGCVDLAVAPASQHPLRARARRAGDRAAR